MDDANDAAGALLALAKEGSAARTKIDKFRELLPAIDAAQASGISHEKILQTLNEHGWDLKMPTYQTMLWRLRNNKIKKYAGAAKDMPAAPAVENTPGKQTDLTPREISGSKPVPQSADEGSEKSEALETQTRREQKSRQYISDDSTNPLLKRLKKD